MTPLDWGHNPMRHYIIILMISLALASCATPYKPMGVMGGVDDMQISDATYRIRARGNGFTNPERVEDFVLLRASEIAIQRGYPYFIIMQSTDRTRTASATTPGSVETTGFAAGNSFGSTDCRPNCLFPQHETDMSMGGAVGDTKTTYTPAQTHIITKPGAEVIIQLLKSKENVAGIVYDARAVNASLSKELE